MYYTRIHACHKISGLKLNITKLIMSPWKHLYVVMYEVNAYPLVEKTTFEVGINLSIKSLIEVHNYLRTTITMLMLVRKEMN